MLAVGGRYERGNRRTEHREKLVKHPLEKKRSGPIGTKKKRGKLVEQIFMEESVAGIEVRKRIVEKLKQTLQTEQMVPQPLEEKIFESMGAMKKSGESVEHLKMEEFADEIEVKKKRVENLKQTLPEKRDEARGLKRKVYDFVTHSFEDVKDEAKGVGKGSVGGFKQSLEEKRFKAWQEMKKGEQILSPDLLLGLGDLIQAQPEVMKDTVFHKADLAKKSAQQRSGNETDISKIEYSLLSKSNKDMVDTATKYVNHLIQLELVEMEEIKSEESSERVETKKLARDKEEEISTLEKYKTNKNAKIVQIIVPGMVDRGISKTIDFSIGEFGNLVTQKHQDTTIVENQGDGNAQLTNQYEIKLEEDNDEQQKANPKETVDEFDETDYQEEPADTVEKLLMNKDEKKNLESSFLGYLEFLDCLNTSLNARDIEKAQTT